MSQGGLYNGREGYCAQVREDLERLQVDGTEPPSFCYGPLQLAAAILEEEDTPAWRAVGKALGNHLLNRGADWQADCTLVELAAAAVKVVPIAYVEDWNLQHRGR